MNETTTDAQYTLIITTERYHERDFKMEIKRERKNLNELRSLSLQLKFCMDQCFCKGASHKCYSHSKTAFIIRFDEMKELKLDCIN